MRIDWPSPTEEEKIHQAMSMSGNQCIVLSAVKDEMCHRFPSILFELGLPRKCYAFAASRAGGVVVANRRSQDNRFSFSPVRPTRINSAWGWMTLDHLTKLTTDEMLDWKILELDQMEGSLQSNCLGLSLTKAEFAEQCFRGHKTLALVTDPQESSS